MSQKILPSFLALTFFASASGEELDYRIMLGASDSESESVEAVVSEVPA